MARPIYGMPAENAAQNGCCDDLQLVSDFVTKNTQILKQLLTTKDKGIANQRLDLVITDLRARMASSLTTIPITTNVPGARTMSVKKKDSGQENPRL
jgi:hypothetical protein